MTSVRSRVKELCERVPVYENRLVRSRAYHNRQLAKRDEVGVGLVL